MILSFGIRAGDCRRPLAIVAHPLINETPIPLRLFPSRKHMPGRSSQKRQDVAGRRTGALSLVKKRRHLVQTLNDDQMDNTSSGGPGLGWTQPATLQDANRGADGRVRVSDRD